jgi:hypothetical protein
MRYSRQTLLTAALLIPLLIRSQPSPVSAQSPNELLEKGIYAEEMLGDVEGAIDIYRQLLSVREPNRRTAAHALLRLGLCYVRTGRHNEATAAFDQLTRSYSEQKDLVAKIPRTNTSRLDLRPVSVDDEVFVFYSPSRNLYDLHRLRAEVHNSRAVSRIDRSEHGWHMSSAIVDRETMHPVERNEVLTVTWPALRIEYRRDEAEVLHRNRAETRRRRFSDTGVLYDGTTLVQIVRRLPLAIGFRISIPYLDPLAGKREATVSVVGLERISVPAGTFNAYKVKIAFSSVDEQEWWYSNDESRYPLRSMPDAYALIQLPSHKAVTRDVRLEAKGMRAHLTLPSGWAVTPPLPMFSASFDLVSAGLSGRGRVMLLRCSTPSSETRRSTLQWLARESRLTVRDGGPEDLEIGGCTATRLVADRENGTIVYRAHMNCGEQCVSVAFESTPEHWDASKPQFDEIIGSLCVE